MKVIQVVVGIVIAWVIVSFFNYTHAFAGHNENCPPNNPNCNVYEPTDGGGDTITNNYLGGAGGAGGAGGNATIGDTTIRNRVDITNTATGGNANAKATAKGGNATATGGTANAEGGAGGAGGNATAAGGQGGSSDVSVKFDNPVQHVNPARAMEVDAKLTDHGDKLSIKTKGSVWAHKQSFTYAQASRLGSGASDAKIETGLFTTYGKTATIGVVATPGDAEFMGYIYILPDGPDCTLAQMEGKIMKASMDAGGTHIIPDVDQGVYLEGSSWNVGFGGGASILSGDGQTAIAPNGGTGFGKAKSNNEVRPAIVVAVYRFEWPKQELPYIPLDDSNYEGGGK